MVKTLEISEEKLTQSQALAWLIELERLSDPNFNNALILNIYKISNNINDIQIVADQNNKRMLIYLELNWWGKHFKKVKISTQVSKMLKEILPSYEFRVVYDLEIVRKALDLLKKNAIITEEGGSNYGETKNRTPSTTDSQK